ncbi:hypothetical protein N005_06635 [Pseudomonas mediterranea CFBP 5447]|nr:hypothetical protein N005_06635 [Pseudomonas mediterranea CFBP 5447]
MFDITGLTAFITATQQNDQLSALLHEIDSIAGTIIDTRFAQTFSYSFDISQISISHAIDSNLNANSGAAVCQL